MKLSRFFFYLYVPLVLLFFWRTAVFWMSDRYGDQENAGLLLYAALLGIELMAIFLIGNASYKRGDRGIHLICFLWEIVMLVVMMYNHASIPNCAKCLAWPLFFESAYLFVKRRPRNLAYFRWIFYALVAIGAFFFFKAMALLGYGFQTNMVYFLILPVPVILCTKNPKRRILILILATFLAILSMKRSVMLAMVLTWGVIGIKYLFASQKKGRAIVLSVLLAFAAVASYSVANRLTGGTLSSRFDDDDADVTNGRAAIYAVTWDMIANSSTLDIILGHGHMAVRADSILEISAHNDWLEILYDYGAISLFLYLCLMVYVIKQWIYHFRNNTIYYIPYTLSLCILVVMSMVSQLVVYVSYFLYLVMFWGMVAGVKEVQNKQINTTDAVILY